MSFFRCALLLVLVATAVGCGAGQDSTIATAAASPAATPIAPSLAPVVDETVAVEGPVRPGWPSVDGYSDPNLIVYDKARFDRYLAFCATDNVIACGHADREMTIGDRTVQFGTGLDYENAGHRFHLDHLRKFLRSRIAGTTPEYSDEEALKKVGRHWSLYAQDVCACVNLIASAGAAEALPEIDALLSDRDGRARGAAIWAVYRLGPAASASVPKLVELLETEAARDVSQALGKIGADAVPALTNKVNRGSTDARAYAIDALGLIGPAAATAVDELIKALHEKKDAFDDSGSISSYAAEALGHIGDRRALAHLRQMTSADNYNVQRISKAAIGEIEGGPRFERR
jgi:hypothetical protein